MLLEPFGVQLAAEVVDDRSLRDPTRSDGMQLQSMEFCAGAHAIDAPLKNRVVLFLGPSRRIVVGSDHAPGATRTVLLRASAEADAVPLTHDISQGTCALIEGKRQRTPDAVLAVALSRKSANSVRESRLVVFGGGGIIAPNEFSLATHFGNRDLILNAVTWLCDRPFSVEQTAQAEERPRVVSVAAYAGPLQWVGVILLPLVALCIATGVYFARRST
jgi:hypothetical protein